MENLVINGQITATSKKNDGKFKQEVATKTAYLKVDETSRKALIEFGLTEYGSDDKFFIIKFPKNVMVYQNGFGVNRPDLSQVILNGEETNNFKTPDNKLLKLNIIKGDNLGNVFHRLQAIRIDTPDDIEEILPENPFGDEAPF